MVISTIREVLSMDKIKLLYDVVQTMRNKETIKGNLNVEVQRENVFTLKKDFEKNLPAETFQVNTELNCQGEEFKHKSRTEFITGHWGDKHEMFKQMHFHHNACCGGIKGKLNKLAFALGLLNNLEVKQQEDGIALSLSLDKIPEEIKALCREKREHLHGKHHGNFFEEGCSFEKENLTVKVLINPNDEITRIEAVTEGTKTDKKGTSKIQGKAEVNFDW